MILPLSLTLSPEYGLDPIPTFVAMTLLAIPPILIGAYAGLRSVDADLVEAGRGMGLRERQILTQLELPLVVGVIVGGFRTATLQVIATATIGGDRRRAAGSAASSSTGSTTRTTRPSIGGVILVATLAIGADLVLAVRPAAGHPARRCGRRPPRGRRARRTSARRSPPATRELTSRVVDPDRVRQESLLP